MLHPRAKIANHVNQVPPPHNAVSNSRAPSNSCPTTSLFCRDLFSFSYIEPPDFNLISLRDSNVHEDILTIPLLSPLSLLRFFFILYSLDSCCREKVILLMFYRIKIENYSKLHISLRSSGFATFNSFHKKSVLLTYLQNILSRNFFSEQNARTDSFTTINLIYLVLSWFCNAFEELFFRTKCMYRLFYSLAINLIFLILCWFCNE